MCSPRLHAFLCILRQSQFSTSGAADSQNSACALPWGVWLVAAILLNKHLLELPGIVIAAVYGRQEGDGGKPVEQWGSFCWVAARLRKQAEKTSWA